MSKKFALLPAAELTKKITEIGRSSARLNVAIQIAAVNAIGQSIIHRNVTPMNQLYAAVGKTVRRDSLVRYLETHGNCAFVTADKAFKFFEVKKPEDFDGDVLMGMAWDAATKEKIDSIYDVAELVDKLIKKIEASIEKTHQVKNGDLLDELKLVMRDFHAGQYVEASETNETTGE